MFFRKKTVWATDLSRFDLPGTWSPTDVAVLFWAEHPTSPPRSMLLACRCCCSPGTIFRLAQYCLFFLSLTVLHEREYNTSTKEQQGAKRKKPSTACLTLCGPSSPCLCEGSQGLCYLHFKEETETLRIKWPLCSFTKGHSVLCIWSHFYASFCLPAHPHCFFSL